MDGVTRSGRAALLVKVPESWVFHVGRRATFRAPLTTTSPDPSTYAALIDVVARTVGEDAADTIRKPFCLSNPAEVAALVAAYFANDEVHRHHGVARFHSIESMVRAEIWGWTLSDTIDDKQIRAPARHRPDRLGLHDRRRRPHPVHHAGAGRDRMPLICGVF